MNKASQAHIDRALVYFQVGKDRALLARTLTAEHRCATTKANQREIEDYIRLHCANHVERLANGCLIEKRVAA